MQRTVEETLECMQRQLYGIIVCGVVVVLVLGAHMLHDAYRYNSLYEVQTKVCGSKEG